MGISMKKHIILLFTLCIYLLFVGCGQKEAGLTEEGIGINVCYLNKEETRISTEVKMLDRGTTKEMVVQTLQFLALAPDNVELKAPISSNFSVISYDYEEKQVTVTVSEQYKKLSNTTEILTRAAIVRSLTQIPGVDYVCMTINGEPLKDSNMNAVGFMTADMFIDNEGEEINAYEKTTLRLYFANETGDKLVAINRSIIYNSNISLEKLVVEQIISGPISEESFPTMGADTKLIGTTVKDGVCYVNFDSSFLTQTLHVTTDVTIYSIVNSLIELSNINKVQIMVDGVDTAIYREKYPLSTVFERDLSLIE